MDVLFSEYFKSTTVGVLLDLCQKGNKIDVSDENFCCRP